MIESENPDVVCLQEVDRGVRRSRHDDQPKLLAEALHTVGRLYQLNVRLKTGGYGNLVLSRWPFHQTHQISLRLRDRKPRGAQLAVIRTPEGPLHLAHTHLGLADRERHWQVARLMEHPLFKAASHLPTVVVGDLNDWGNTLAPGPFQGHGFHQVTAPRSRFRSFPAYWPVVALDKAFTRGPIEVQHARIVHSAVARTASDHLPLVIDFHLRPPTPPNPPR